jgi:hypothetical protein
VWDEALVGAVVGRLAGPASGHPGQSRLDRGAVAAVLPAAVPWRGVKVCSDPALEARSARWSGCIWIPRVRWWSASNETF